MLLKVEPASGLELVRASTDTFRPRSCIDDVLVGESDLELDRTGDKGDDREDVRLDIVDATAVVT